jgi:hypothetical protein
MFHAIQLNLPYIKEKRLQSQANISRLRCEAAPRMGNHSLPAYCVECRKDATPVFRYVAPTGGLAGFRLLAYSLRLVSGKSRLKHTIVSTQLRVS